MNHIAIVICEKLEWISLKNRTHRHDLDNKSRNQYKRIFTEKKIEIKVIMDCRKTSLHKFRTKLRFRQYDVILAKDKSVLTKIKSYFERENTQAQYNVLSYRITLFCHGYKVAIKIDETGHSGHRNIDY